MFWSMTYGIFLVQMITVFNLRSYAVLQGPLFPKVNRQEIIDGKTDPYRSKQRRKEKGWINKLKKYIYV